MMTNTLLDLVDKWEMCAKEVKESNNDDGMSYHNNRDVGRAEGKEACARDIRKLIELMEH